MASAQYGCKTDVFFESLQEFDNPDEGMYSDDLEGFDARDFDDEEDSDELVALPCEPAIFVVDELVERI